MSRLPRFCPAGLPQHIIQRGNNRSICFASDEDFAAYAHWLHEYSVKFYVDIHAWVFMTNHVHLLATPSTDNGIALMMQALGRRYVQYFNFTYQRSGSLWEGRYKSSTIDTERYLLVCYRYIELNLVRANMVDDPAGYKWSSYRCNALGVELSLCTPHGEYLCLGQTIDERQAYYRGLFSCHIEDKLLDDVRSALNKGLALGSEDFRDQVEMLYGQRVKPARMGRSKS
jgi:putative transposase